MLCGASASDRRHLRHALWALPVAYPTEQTWRILDGWVDTAATAGQRFGFGDLVIAALAAESGSFLWSLDSDFERMERFRMVACYEPPSAQRPR